MRGLMSLWNDTGVVIAFLLCIGYFGSRLALAFAPLALLTLFVVGGIGGCLWIAIQTSAPADSYSEGTPWGDRALWFVVIFLLGTLGVTLLGAAL